MRLFFSDTKIQPPAKSLENVIPSFLDNSRYLNNNNKRDSSFLFFLNNRMLTSKLEQKAMDLRNQLKGMQNSTNDKDKMFADFLIQIKNVITDVRELRLNHATPYHYEGNFEDGRHHCWEAYDYKYPYKPSKFERELIKGLKAVLDVIPEDKQDLKGSINEILGDLEGFKPRMEKLNYRFSA